MHQHGLFVLFPPGEVGFSAKSCHKGGRNRICVWNSGVSVLKLCHKGGRNRICVWNSSISKMITENTTNEWDFETNFSDASASIVDVFLWQKQFENRGVRAFSTTTKTVIKITIILTPHACLILRCCETEVRPQHGWGLPCPSMAGAWVDYTAIQ